MGGGKVRPSLRVAQLVERRIVDHWCLLKNSPQVIGSIPVSKKLIGPLAQW